MKIERKIKKILKKLTNTRNLSNVKEISYDKLRELQKTKNNLKIIDTRSPQEFAENRIEYAINIPVYELKRKADIILKNKNELIIVYCQYGERSKKACQILEAKGYTNVYSLEGGIESIR